MSDKLDACPICDSKFENPLLADKETFVLKCSICGSFSIEVSLLKNEELMIKMQKARFKMSGIIRYINLERREKPNLNLQNIDEYIANPVIPDLRDVELKLNLLLSAMKRKAVILGQTCTINLDKDYPLAFAWNSSELEKLLESLEEDGLIELEAEPRHVYSHDPSELPKTFKDRNKGSFWSSAKESSYSFHISRKGWTSFNNKTDGNQGFIAIDFDDSMDEAIKAISDGIYECGYSPMAIKDKDYPETIMEKALGEIKKSIFVIVDITNLRPSVFYEAGFAHAIGKPVFYVCKKSFIEDLKKQQEQDGRKRSLEFYSKHYKIRQYKDSNELKKLIIVLVEANFPIKK